MQCAKMERHSPKCIPWNMPWHASPKYVKKELLGKESQENIAMLSSSSAFINSQHMFSYESFCKCCCQETFLFGSAWYYTILLTSPLSGTDHDRSENV